MTNLLEPASPDAKQALRHWLAAHGVDNTRGVEVLGLVRAANSAYEAALSETVADEPLTPHRWRVLMRIWMEEATGGGAAGTGGGAVYPTQLSRAEHVSKNTMSEHLRALEDAGLIERELDPDDRRQFRIRLSPTGRALVSRCAPDHMHRLNYLLTGLTPGELGDLTRLLDRLKQVLVANARQLPFACGQAHEPGAPDPGTPGSSTPGSSTPGSSAPGQDHQPEHPSL